MAIHKSVLKGYGDHIFADEWGYIPQIGDSPNSFDWGRPRVFSRREWNSVIFNCEKQVKEALKKLRGG